MDSLIKLLQQRFRPVAQAVPQMAKQAASGFQQSPLGVLAQGKPQQFMPALKQRADFFVQHPQNISFGGEMKMVNPGGFAGALPFNTQVDQMTSKPMGGPSLARSGFNQYKPIDPTRLNNEQIIEQTGGWQPGVRAKFDVAMLMKNPTQVKQLLPLVPQAYKAKFAQTIAQVLGGGVK